MEYNWKSDQEGRPQGIGHLLHCGQDPLHSCQVHFPFWDFVGIKNKGFEEQVLSKFWHCQKGWVGGGGGDRAGGDLTNSRFEKRLFLESFPYSQALLLKSSV